MARFRYDITIVPAGWQVTCNGTAGPAYPDRDTAVIDTLAIADRLRGQGHLVDVRLFDIDGTGQVLEPKDAKLFTSSL